MVQKIPFSWHCPFCDQNATITGSDYNSEMSTPPANTLGDVRSILQNIVCPNPVCKQLCIGVKLYEGKMLVSIGWQPERELQSWRLRPASSARFFPEYVPTAVREDYTEACLIRDASPKAAATLARRCLQGMIRNFWKINKNRLADAIKELEDKVDPLTWKAIDGVRTVGNIGAHMEKDIDLIVDVDEEEAGALIGLVEILVEDWYVDRHNKQQRLQAIVDIAAEKEKERKADTE